MRRWHRHVRFPCRGLCARPDIGGGAPSQGHVKIALCVASVADREKMWAGGPLLALRSAACEGLAIPASSVHRNHHKIAEGDT
jgi:hypothetical protein